MFMVSDRRDFWDPEEIGSETLLADVQADFSMGPFSWNDLKGKRVLLLIHGSSESKEETLPTYLYLESQMQSFIGSYDAVVGYLWPRFGSVLQGGLLRNTIDRIAAHATALDLMAHGIGNGLVLEACRDLKKRSSLRDYFLTAPAINPDSKPQFQSLSTHFRRLFLFHGREDYVLPFLSLLSNRRLEFDEFEPLKNMQLIDCSEVVDGYESYWNCPEIFQLMKADAMGILPRNPFFELLPGGQVSRG
jgi:esterase/lipase superfamily enzyme